MEEDQKGKMGGGSHQGVGQQNVQGQGHGSGDRNTMNKSNPASQTGASKLGQENKDMDEDESFEEEKTSEAGQGVPAGVNKQDQSSTSKGV